MGQTTSIKGSTTSPHGIVAGPFIGDPVTCLEVCTAKDVRGDILVGQAGGQLRMYSARTNGSDQTEEDLMESGYKQDAEAHVRFRTQPPLPRTDGKSHYTSDHAVLSLLRDDNVHAIMGAYCDGLDCYTVARSMGGCVIPLRGNTEAHHEEQYRFTVQDRYASRASTYIMQHRQNFLCLSGGRDGASIDGTNGYEVDVRQPFDGTGHNGDDGGGDGGGEDFYQYGLKLDKRDIPVFFDGEYLVVMRTRASSDDPTYKERTITVYGGWGRDDGDEPEEKEEKEKEKEEEGKGHQDQDAGENTEAIQVELDESTDSIAASDIDNREYDPTEGLYVVADLLFPMPPRRKSIGATGFFAWEVPLGCCRCTTHEYH